jgi:hypothetical protein
MGRLTPTHRKDILRALQAARDLELLPVRYIGHRERDNHKVYDLERERKAWQERLRAKYRPEYG